jgi:ABC-2 type transport system permease protein
MYAILVKEINTFFSSLIGYVVIGTFLVVMGLVMFVFPDSSVLEGNFANLDTLFIFAPMIFMFLIPAVTMRTLAEEQQTGTIELLVTRPVTDAQIVLAKFFACVILVVFALLPTLAYYYTVYNLGATPGNLDTGGIMGSYIGLLFLAASFVAVGLFASSLTNNQIVSAGHVFVLFLFHGLRFFEPTACVLRPYRRHCSIVGHPIPLRFHESWRAGQPRPDLFHICHHLVLNGYQPLLGAA